ncbi:MAG: class I tRNA ligase family protein [bacterium]
MTKTYILGMFPYPSGEGLHVGHVRIFTACDVMARYFKMKQNVSYPLGGSRALGFPREHSVLSPMGWDAFGLPAENAAIKAKKIPQEMVPHNYANFKKQMQNLSLDFDWEREFATTDPSYYAITQWIFLQLYGKKDDQGRRLVYREKVAINWCPKCLTGLANEEVLADGTHERCGTVVGKKLLPQWVMRITSYAERLLNDLDIDLHIEGKKLDPERKGLDWPKGILEMQRNWIGKKEGARVKFQITNQKFSNSQIKELEVFTTRIDTINGVTFVVVAPELIKDFIVKGFKASEEVKSYVEMALQKSEQARLEGEKDKTGVDTLMKATNPFNEEEIPVWVADYALANVGTGAVMGVPQYDERDLAFATKFGLPVKELELDNYEEVLAKLEKMNVAKKETTYHLRDWVFSRQRYWGEPIPLVFCTECAKKITNPKFSNSQINNEFDVVEKDGEMVAVVPVPEDQLPLELPTLKSYEPTETGESPLSRVEDWVNTTCPKCGGPAKRETDTMPNWAGSCWYFLAFPFWAAKQAGEKINNLNDAKKYIKEWSPVDWYLGGAEHAVLHLLYARFWVKVLQDLKILDFPEPFLRLRSVGLVLAEDGKKMSKSIGNVVNPDDMVAKYGSDSVRMYEMFMGPWDQSIAWDSGAISGQVRFLGRIKQTMEMAGKTGEKTSPLLAVKLKTLVARVEDGVLNQKFNTSIAGLMEFINTWREPEMVLSKEHLNMFASLLSLFAPETANSIRPTANGSYNWPDVSKIEGVDEVMVTIAVQISGKLRGTVQVSSPDAGNQDKVLEVVKKDDKISKWLTSEIKKAIFVPGKLVNLVV